MDKSGSTTRSTPTPLHPGQAHDTPLHHLHFRVDAPLDIKALLYVPSFHSEKFGMARLEPGVSLYSRKVLIEQSPEDLLPSWLRFVRGVVDSEDVPLAISREKAQDRALVRKIRDVVTRKLLRHWDGMLRRQPTEYRAFFHEFGVFLKEGACQDYENMEQIAKLLLFESSALDAGRLTTLDEYLARASLGKDTIYYLSASTRALAEASPYYEAFKKAGREVLFVYNTIDDFTLTNIARYNNREIRSAEALKPEDLDTPESDAEPSAADESAPKTGRAAPLTEADADALSRVDARGARRQIARREDHLSTRGLARDRHAARIGDAPPHDAAGRPGAVRRQGGAAAPAARGQSVTSGDDPARRASTRGRHGRRIARARAARGRADL